MFITLFLAVLDTQQDKITYARAGHEAALLAKKDLQQDGIIQLKGNGMALGMVEPSLFSGLIEDKEVSFSAGDLLCLFTDGLTETTNSEGEEFGVFRLQNELMKSSNVSPETFNQQIINSLNKFCNQNNDRDDLTILTVRRL